MNRGWGKIAVIFFSLEKIRLRIDFYFYIYLFIYLISSAYIRLLDSMGKTELELKIQNRRDNRCKLEYVTTY